MDLLLGFTSMGVSKLVEVTYSMCFCVSLRFSHSSRVLDGVGLVGSVESFS